MFDIYVNGSLLIDDFYFRGATPFVTVPAGVPLDLGVALGNSISVNDTIRNFPMMLAGGETYVAIANGVLDPAQFAANPAGLDINLTILVKDNAREQANNPNKVDLFMVHGASDAPAVNIIGLGIILKNLIYGDISDYMTLPAWKNWLVMYTPCPHFRLIGVFTADLRSLEGQSAVVFVSGFLDSTANQNGAALGIYAALASGTVVELPKIFGMDAQQILAQVDQTDFDHVTGLRSVQIAVDFQLQQNYPNPFNPTTKIRFMIPSVINGIDSKNFHVRLTVYDILGNEITKLVDEFKNPGEYEIEFSASAAARPLSSGVYFYRLEAGGTNLTRSFILLK